MSPTGVVTQRLLTANLRSCHPTSQNNLVSLSSLLLLSSFYLCISNYFVSITQGNWDRDVQESRYSAKVPISAIRCMAGFEVSDSFWLPRGNLEVPKDVKNLVWPWLDSAEDFTLAYTEEGIEDDDDQPPPEHPTTMEFLRFLKFLRTVFIQDMAATICPLQSSENPRAKKRQSQDLFCRFPMFLSPFLVLHRVNA